MKKELSWTGLIITAAMFFILLALGACGGSGSGGESSNNSEDDNNNSSSEFIQITSISPVEGTVIDRGSNDWNDVDFSVTFEWSIEGNEAEFDGGWVMDSGFLIPVCHDEVGQDYWNSDDCFDNLLVTSDSGTMTYTWTNHNWIAYPDTLVFRVYMWTENGAYSDSVTFY